jgi:hypothetical protein
MWADATAAEPAAAVFLLHSGSITGPARLSTLGVRAVKEQTSVGSSLFAQHLMLEAVPLEEPSGEIAKDGAVILSGAKDPEAADMTLADRTFLPPNSASAPPTPSALSPELRATNLIASLEEQASAPTDLATLSDHLSLLRRWYYRPEKQRTGEVFFPRDDDSWPIRRILRGAARMALGDPAPMAETHRELVVRNPAGEAQKPARSKVLHKGRPDVERIVTIPDATPEPPPTFTSRRKHKP